MKINSPFIEVDFAQQKKNGQGAAGDVFLSRRVGRGRIVCVLADGLGSGIKAGVLATLTATMAVRYTSSDMDISKAARIILETLPSCSRRKIGYCTFTIVDIHEDGQVRIVEHDNPNYLLMNGSREKEIEKEYLTIDTVNLGTRRLSFSRFDATRGIRLILFSDGITQSGMGTDRLPLGWTDENALRFVKQQIDKTPAISSRRLSRDLVEQALKNDRYAAKDDISCAVINFRDPRKLLVMTGPPYDRKNDPVLAHKFTVYEGNKILCGGTTANIIARETGKKIQLDLSKLWTGLPPKSQMTGADLVTEGTLTLGKALEILKYGTNPDMLDENPATELVKKLFESDCIDFVVGTKINEAHQAPNIPDVLDIRRNILKAMVELLNEKYLKHATIEYI